MLDAINTFCLAFMDLLFSWILHFPLDIVLFFIALSTSVILISVRKISTNQNLLARCKADKRTLKKLLRKAKSKGDKDAIKRYRQTMSQIGGKVLLAEPKPLLIAIIPIAMLAVWAFARVAYEPATSDDTITIKAYFQVSSIGDHVHLLPAEGMTAKTGWIQKISADESVANSITGVATWQLQCEQRNAPYPIVVRYNGELAKTVHFVDGLKYSQPLVFHDNSNIIATELVLSQYKPFGILPGIPSLMLQPWILGYLIYVIPLSLLLKYIFRVY